MFWRIKNAFSPQRKLYRRFILLRKLENRNSNPPIQSLDELNTLMNERAYLQDLEIPVLQNYAKSAKDFIVEIGCAFGASSALFLANAAPTVKIHSIDPFIVDSMGTLQATKSKCEMNVRQVLEVLQRTDRIEKWTLHTDYSYNVVNTWTNPIDVLFIDGNHNYEAVKQDFTQWFPKIKFGGIILFHDSRKEAGTPRETFNRGWEGPTQLAKELLDDHRLKLIEEAFSLTVWKKIHD